MNSFIAVTTLIALTLFLNNEPAQSLEKQAVSDTQRTLASDLDAELPKLPFTDWFVKVVGPGAGVVWQLGECGEQVDAAANGDGDTQACVEVNATLSDGRRAIVMIVVGTFKKGLTGPPAFRFGVIEQKGKLRPIRRLSELQNLLSGQGEPAKSPAAILPEVSMSSVRLAPNNAYSTGTPPWTGDDFGQLMPIEDQGPPPAPPPPAAPLTAELSRTSPATSNSTSNTERRDALDGVRQGAPIFKPQPKYPQNAKRFNASGRVEVRVTISVAGRVTKAVAISGHPLLREAAVEAARRWEFEPTTVNGVPIETELVLTFEFAAPPPP